MPTTFVKGDFIAEAQPGDDGLRVYAFPAEASGKMETGVAVAVRRKWPAIASWWEAEGGKKQVGIATAFREGDDLVYAVAVERTGARAKLSWLEGAARAMLADAARRGVARISAARLWGGGRGAVDGARAKRVLTEIGESSPVELVVFEQFVRARPGEPVALPSAPGEPEAPARETKAKTKTKTKPPAKKKTAAKKKPAAKKKTTAKKTMAAAPAKKKPASAPKKKPASATKKK